MVQKAKTEVVGMKGWDGSEGREIYGLMMRCFWATISSENATSFLISCFCSYYICGHIFCNYVVSFVAFRQLAATS